MTCCQPRRTDTLCILSHSVGESQMRQQHGNDGIFSPLQRICKCGNVKPCFHISDQILQWVHKSKMVKLNICELEHFNSTEKTEEETSYFHSRPKKILINILFLYTEIHQKYGGKQLVSSACFFITYNINHVIINVNKYEYLDSKLMYNCVSLTLSFTSQNISWLNPLFWSIFFFLLWIHKITRFLHVLYFDVKSRSLTSEGYCILLWSTPPTRRCPQSCWWLLCMWTAHYNHCSHPQDQNNINHAL